MADSTEYWEQNVRPLIEKLDAVNAEEKQFLSEQPISAVRPIPSLLLRELERIIRTRHKIQAALEYAEAEFCELLKAERKAK